MRDKQFVINSIKMDLHRVVNASGDISKALPKESIREFLTHAINDFSKIEVTPLEESLKGTLQKLTSDLDNINDPHKRLRWTEDVLTTRCRL